MADPKIRFDIIANAEGEEDVRRLAAELEKLDTSIDPQTAGRARELSTQIRTLGEQSAAMERFLRSLTDANEASRALGTAQQALAKLEAQLVSVQEPTRKQTGQLAKLRDAVASAQDKLTDSTATLNTNRTALESLGVSTSELGASQAKLAESLSDAKREAASLGTQYQQTAATIEEGAAAMRVLEQASAQAEAQFRELAASLVSTAKAATAYAAATENAAAAGKDDAAAMRQRLAAADALLQSEAALSVEQRELARVRDGSRAALLAEAQGLLAVAAAARETQAATTATAVAARQAGESINQAFGALGIRSIDAIETEIEQTSRALTRLEIAARAGALGQDELGRAAGAAEVKLARLRAEVLQVQATPGQLEKLSSSINGIATRFAGLAAAVATVGFAARPVIEATIALEQMRRVLTTVTGSAEVAEQQIAALRLIAQQSGQSFSDIGESYAKFAASALQSGLSLQQTSEAFKAVVLAAGNLGLSTEQAKRA